jgi:hypothetical protein
MQVEADQLSAGVSCVHRGLLTEVAESDYFE